MAALLKGLPLALMEQDAARWSLSVSSGRDAGGTAADGVTKRIPLLAVPHSLMLAVYPGGGARYVAHLDNDVDDPRTKEGPHGSPFTSDLRLILWLVSDAS